MQILGVANFTATIPNAFMQSSRRPQPVSATAAWAAPNLKQITHSMPPEKIELFKSLKPWASENLVPLLSPVDTCWQPNQLLPDPAGPVADFMNDVRALRDRTKELSDEYIVVLVGNMITEQANPTYMAVLNTADGTRDETGNSPCPWAVWTRAWTAEENRHGDVLKSYLYLSGRVDMLSIERTVQYLIRAGMNPGLENSPFLGYVYSSFQERATFVTYCNTSRLAKEGGDPVLANICDVIAADEKRHEGAYIKIVEKLLEVDPNETMLAIAKLLRNKITMPAHLMYDGHDPQLFQHFSFVSHKLGVYTPTDYADIIDFFVGRWSLEKLQGLKADGRREQEYVCNLAPTIRKLQAQAEDRVSFPRVKFSWIFNRQV